MKRIFIVILLVCCIFTTGCSTGLSELRKAKESQLAVTDYIPNDDGTYSWPTEDLPKDFPVWRQSVDLITNNSSIGDIAIRMKTANWMEFHDFIYDLTNDGWGSVWDTYYSYNIGKGESKAEAERIAKSMSNILQNEKDGNQSIAFIGTKGNVKVTCYYYSPDSEKTYKASVYIDNLDDSEAYTNIKSDNLPFSIDVRKDWSVKIENDKIYVTYDYDDITSYAISTVKDNINISVFANEYITYMKIKGQTSKEKITIGENQYDCLTINFFSGNENTRGIYNGSDNADIYGSYWVWRVGDSVYQCTIAASLPYANMSKKACMESIIRMVISSDT